MYVKSERVNRPTFFISHWKNTWIKVSSAWPQKVFSIHICDHSVLIRGDTSTMTSSLNHHESYAAYEWSQPVQQTEPLTEHSWSCRLSGVSCSSCFSAGCLDFYVFYLQQDEDAARLPPPESSALHAFSPAGGWTRHLFSKFEQSWTALMKQQQLWLSSSDSGDGVAKGCHLVAMVIQLSNSSKCVRGHF